ncbi:presqualene diphosphate synthase HpnD [Enterovirga rhinocerotis]|uniref:Farnesyl-diphosphate farnesyltransferase n=1 Tax=Enterovirga rhinocerotis TaxID=1339210 RepID=A0A4R7C7S4_9HYPH|nr:presqualene diphosphate synthase HpnD [Enterovirga rhinocerotis]TDR94478.1 farnesyl-diphosphate farnesyltransferase [Enterovirga rhinocerotis]
MSATAGSAQPASGSSFYLGMRLLPKPKREAMFAIYGFCRIVDDIADDGGPRPERKIALDQWREDIDALYRGDVRPNVAFLAPHVEAYGLEHTNFLDVIDGMEMDVTADIQAPDWSTLDLYCDRVASAVGRLSTRVFGLEKDRGDALAHHLGRALQLTNILRDVDEDAAIDRLYLPREALEKAGMTDLSPAAVLAHPGLDEACREVAARAHHHYEQADRLMQGQPRSIVRAPRLMEAAYRSVLDRLLVRGFAPPRPRVGVQKGKLVLALVRQFFR